MTLGWVAYLYTASFIGIRGPTGTAPGEGVEGAISALDRKLTLIGKKHSRLLMIFLSIPKSEVL
jgi:hypothetical protein